MEEEVWKDIPNYFGLYQVSNFGRVKSLERYIISNDGKKYHRKELLIKCCANNNGYLFCNLYKDGKSINKKIHQLVAICFLNHIPDGHKIVVDHINAIKIDNRVENLRLLTNRENCTSSNKVFKRKPSSKYIGVYFNKQRNKWISEIFIKNKKIYLGCFKTEIEASEAYQNELNKILEK